MRISSSSSSEGPRGGNPVERISLLRQFLIVVHDGAIVATYSPRGKEQTRN
jgi:hypothetical protein